MAKRITDTERLITFAMNASEDTLSSTIQTLAAIRNNRFPTEKKSRKPRKPKEPSAEKKNDKPPHPARAQTAKTDEPEGSSRKCVSCEWTGQQAHPQPCPDCGEKTEAK
jgi:hypothetical protein